MLYPKRYFRSDFAKFVPQAWRGGRIKRVVSHMLPYLERNYIDIDAVLALKC